MCSQHKETSVAPALSSMDAVVSISSGLLVKCLKWTGLMCQKRYPLDSWLIAPKYKALGNGKNKGWFYLCPLGCSWICLGAEPGLGSLLAVLADLARSLTSSARKHTREIRIGRVWQIHERNWLFRCLGLKGICFHSSSFFHFHPSN